MGARGSLRVDYVGTRAVQEPYQVQLNGYQTVCNGCFAPFAYNQPLDRASAASTNSAPARAAITPACKPAAAKQFAGLTCAPTTPSAIASTRSPTAACLPFSSLGILSPLPGSLRPEYGNCDYDVRHNLSAFAVYEIPFRSSQRVAAPRARRLAALGDGDSA